MRRRKSTLVCVAIAFIAAAFLASPTVAAEAAHAAPARPVAPHPAVHAQPATAEHPHHEHVRPVGFVVVAPGCRTELHSYTDGAGVLHSDKVQICD
ncbi:MAG TPA: hypothetical protein VK446_06145 [Methylocystis sp.]|nr:hypothetical protein [Methylocystis sp.]